MWVWVPEGRDAVLATLRRATVNTVDDTGSQQLLRKVRGLASEEFEDVYRPQPHGFSAVPPDGSEGLFLSLSGRSDRLLALGFEHKDKRFRGLSPGEAVVYDHEGNIVRMRGTKGIYAMAEKDHIVVWPKENGKRVYLGGDPDKGHEFAKVVTEGGPSLNVFARIA